MSSSEPGRTRLQRRRVLALAAWMIAAAGAAPALAAQIQVAVVDPVDLTVFDRDTGQTLPILRHDGRLFVAGKPGARYSLRITNRTDRRVLAVLSVDGVNVITGQTASYNQPGYVFGPHESYDVTGWRKSDTEVAGFSFAPLPQSYAARTGRPEDVGVIGMAVFMERSPFEPLMAERGALPAPRSAGATEPVVVTGSRITRRDFAAPQIDEKLGTAHGAREWSVSNQVNFPRATPYPAFVREIQYDTYDNLVARGVIAGGHGGEEPPPRAFPARPHGEGYVPDPPNDW